MFAACLFISYETIMKNARKFSIYYYKFELYSQIIISEILTLILDRETCAKW